MHIRVDRKAFADAAAWVAAAIARNPDTPALAGMLIDAGPGGVLLTGFDTETTHSATIAADIKAEGVALASGKFLVSLASAMKGDVLKLSTDEPYLTLAAGRSKYRVQCVPSKDYPAVPEFPKHVGTIDADMLATALGRVEHAVSKEPSFRAMMAVNIIGSAGDLTLTGTDRFRIAQSRTGWADASGVDFEANVPAAALTAAMKGLEGDVEIGFHDGMFGIASGSRAVITRCMAEEEKFPKLAPIFAREAVLHVDADAPPVIEALKRALLVSDDRALVAVEFTDSLIRITADSATSDGAEEVEAQPGFGEGEMTLKFNAGYLAQALAACPSDRVRFGLIEPSKQMSVTPVRLDGTTDDSARFIVMPRGNL